MKTSSQALLCLQRIKLNLYWKMKFLKQATYMRYVLAKLSKFVQISTLTSPDFFSEESLKIKKGLELVSRPNFSESFLIKNFLLEYCINWPNFITRLFFYFSSYLVNCVLCFMLRYLMTSWHLNTWKVKIWLSQELKEISKWNKKDFSLFHKYYLLDMQSKLTKK